MCVLVLQEVICADGNRVWMSPTDVMLIDVDDALEKQVALYPWLHTTFAY